MTTIAIIGTAGRGSDADRLDARVYGLGTKHCWDNSPAPKKIHISIETLICPATTEQLSLL